MRGRWARGARHAHRRGGERSRPRTKNGLGGGFEATRVKVGNPAPSARRQSRAGRRNRIAKRSRSRTGVARRGGATEHAVLAGAALPRGPFTGRLLAQRASTGKVAGERSRPGFLFLREPGRSGPRWSGSRDSHPHDRVGGPGCCCYIRATSARLEGGARGEQTTGIEPVIPARRAGVSPQHFVCGGEPVGARRFT
jgi:hypothetical protein